MMTRGIHKKVYSTIASLIDYRAMTRSELISKTVGRLTKSNSNTKEFDVGETSALRGEIGAIIDEMTANGLISIGPKGYYLIKESPVILRTEACEREILSLLRGREMSKPQIRAALEEKFGTARTMTQKDDNILFSLIGKILKRLTSLGVIIHNGGMYSIARDKEAKLDDIDAILALKGDFLTRLHARGGEFFEHFFMTLIGKYLAKQGKTIVSNKVMGGVADGGIDGIVETVDPLGFRETVMVQMKNRLEDTNETTVRGFWGAVCAYQGSRGIFATTSCFHPSAAQFLNNIDNCVGIDGDMIFRMSCECLYGIKKRSGKYTVDSKILPGG
jgi:hypothetical protein